MKPNKKIIRAIIASLIVIIIAILAFNLKSDELKMTNRTWVRTLEDNIETISLFESNNFSFSTSVKELKGYNSCTKYRYTERTNTIKVSCKEKVPTKKIIIAKKMKNNLAHF
jgi:hypothetical protein